MPEPGFEPGGSPAAAGTLSADEFAVRFQEAARVLWTVAAGVLGDPSEAEDVLQEACVMALGKLSQYEPQSNFTAWLGRFVRNVALNHARKRWRRSTRAADPATLDQARARRDGTARSPVDDRGRLVRHQEAFDDRVLDGLRGLGEAQRAALLLRTVNGLAYREIAGVLAIPEGTAMSHVHRARQALRRHLTAGASGEPTEGLPAGRTT